MRSDARFQPVDVLDRRRFLGLAASGAAVCLVGGALPARARDGIVDPASVSLMEFDVTYRSEIVDLPSDAEEVRLWMPLPSSDYSQEIRGLEIKSGVATEITHDPVFGARMLYARSGPEPFSAEARYRITRRQVGTEPVRLSERDRGSYLRLADPVRVTPEVEEFARTTIGDATGANEVARRVFDGIGELLVYDKQIPGCGTGDTAWLMRHKRGKCDDYHALFMAILISRGIPVRWEQGFPLPLPSGEQLAFGTLKGDCTGAHCWLSFYDPASGWVPVDASEGDKAGARGKFYFGRVSANRFKVSEGRAVVLSPGQGGDPLPNFAYAYAEADGLPLIYGANYENRIDYEIRRVERA